MDQIIHEHGPVLLVHEANHDFLTLPLEESLVVRNDSRLVLKLL